MNRTSTLTADDLEMEAPPLRLNRTLRSASEPAGSAVSTYNLLDLRLGFLEQSQSFLVALPGVLTGLEYRLCGF